MARRRDRIIEVLPRREWMQVFKTIDTQTPTGRRDRAMYYLMYYCGMRVGEVLYLRVKDIDLAAGTLMTPPEGKTGQRLLAMPDSAKFYDALSAWFDQRKVWDEAGDNEFAFMNRNGNRVLPQNVRDTLHRRAKKAGIEQRVHPHLMRHSFATEMLLEGAEIPEVQRMLGHSSVQTTMIYLHAVPGRPQELMRARNID